MLKLKIEDFQDIKKFVDNSLSLNEENIKSHIENNTNEFKSKLDWSNREDRNHLFQYLSHMKTLYLNYFINGNSYFLSKEEIELSEIGMSTIAKIISNLRGDNKTEETTTSQNQYNKGKSKSVLDTVKSWFR